MQSQNRHAALCKSRHNLRWQCTGHGKFQPVSQQLQPTSQDQFRGVIRVHDVRATEKDKVEMYKSFRPGDIVLAKVISLGDARSYFLSTASNELGVASAKSMAGFALAPINWCEMQCRRTGALVPVHILLAIRCLNLLSLIQTLL